MEDVTIPQMLHGLLREGETDRLLFERLPFPTPEVGVYDLVALDTYRDMGS